MMNTASRSSTIERDFTELTAKRSMLVSARLQFAPEVQEVRQQAIDRCVENVLFGLHEPSGVSLISIEEVLTSGLGGGARLLHVDDIVQSLDRLRGNGHVIAVTSKTGTHYRLSEAALNEIGAVSDAAQKRFNRITDGLFSDVGNRSQQYGEAFFEVLCIIFGQLGESYVKVLKGDAGARSLAKSPVVGAALRHARAHYRQLDYSVLAAGVVKFFETTSPDFDAVKWNLAQNYYIAKCLGLDSTGRLLSRELFGGAVLYLDTNVLLHALEPEALHYRSFEALAKTCDALGIELRVCQISVDEMRAAVVANRRDFQRTVQQIPEQLSNRVHNVFYDAYRRRISAGETPKQATESVFAAYDDAAARLAKLGVSLDDDVWFTNLHSAGELGPLITAIKRRSEKRKTFPKSDKAALHDAQLLAWTARAKAARGGENTWVVTLDRALASFDMSATSGSAGPVAITLDALLQWVSPLAAFSQPFDMAQVFAETIKYQVLPADNFFDVTDFIVFAELEWDCNTLPPDQVEACIRRLKSSTGVINPKLPADREKLARSLRRFFADPGRKLSDERKYYEQTIADRERERDEDAKQHHAAVTGLTEQMTQLQSQFSQVAAELQSLRNDASEMQRQRDTAQEESAARGKTIVAFRRACGGFVLMAGLILLTFLTETYGTGTNLFQKMSEAWALLAASGIGVMGVAGAVAGRENIGGLGKPVDQLLGLNSKS